MTSVTSQKKYKNTKYKHTHINTIPTNTYIHTQPNTQKQTHTQIKQTHTHKHPPTNTHTHTHKHPSTNTHTHKQIITNTCLLISCCVFKIMIISKLNRTYTNTHTHTHTHTQTYEQTNTFAYTTHLFSFVKYIFAYFV